MTERRERWISWARLLRRRWTCRRVSRVPLELVWLRLNRPRTMERVHTSSAPALTVRLAIHPSIVWRSSVSASPALAPYTPARRTFTAGTTRSLLSSLAIHTTWMPRPASVGAMTGASVLRQRTFAGGAAPGFRGTTPVRRSSARWFRTSDAPHLWQAPALGTRAVGSVVRSLNERAGNVGIVAGQTPIVPARVEPRVFAPPPMVARRLKKEAAAHPVLPAAHELRSPFAGPSDPRGGWPMTMAGAIAGAVSPATLASLTEHVVREIDGHVRAKRERLGKV